MRRIAIVVLAACGGGGTSAMPDATSPTDGTTGGTGLSATYPDDVGIGSDPSVIWFEDFEGGSVATITGRYDQTQGMQRMALVTDAPKGMALALTAGGSVSAVDLYKQLPDHDDVYVRWYVKYDANVPWHHSGMWFGGYNPGMPYPSPGAGTQPAGDDRFSISIEPVFDVDTATPRFDFYNYWMGMHSWMAPPINDNGTAYYGNTFAHRNSFTTDPGTWVCLEVHATLNTSGSSDAGAVLEVWKNDALVRRFDGGGPMGWWIRDKFCPADADGTECTDYPAPATDILSLQFRSTMSYGINAFWPQNYITDPAMGTLRFDQMVVATTRVGCMR
jgi:hypothetical protein